MNLTSGDFFFVIIIIDITHTKTMKRLPNNCIDYCAQLVHTYPYYPDQKAPGPLVNKTWAGTVTTHSRPVTGLHTGTVSLSARSYL